MPLAHADECGGRGRWQVGPREGYGHSGRLDGGGDRRGEKCEGREGRLGVGEDLASPEGNSPEGLDLQLLLQDLTHLALLWSLLHLLPSDYIHTLGRQDQVPFDGLRGCRSRAGGQSSGHRPPGSRGSTSGRGRTGQLSVSLPVKVYEELHYMRDRLSMGLLAREGFPGQGTYRRGGCIAAGHGCPGQMRVYLGTGVSGPDEDTSN